MHETHINTNLTHLLACQAGVDCHVANYTWYPGMGAAPDANIECGTLADEGELTRAELAQRCRSNANCRGFELSRANSSDPSSFWYCLKSLARPLIPLPDGAVSDPCVGFYEKRACELATSLQACSPLTHTYLPCTSRYNQSSYA